MDYYSILIVLIIFITIALGVIVIINDRKDSRHQTLFFIILLSAIWITSGFLADHSATLQSALYWTRIAIVPPAFVLPSFLYFSMIFPMTLKKQSPVVVFMLFIPALTYAFLSVTSLNVKGVLIHSWGVEYTPGLLYKIFIPYFIIYFLITLRNFYVSYKRGDRIAKAQISFIILGLLSAFLIGIFTNVILPLLGESQIAVFGPSIAILFLAGFNTYAILKHHLFSIKVVASELLTFIIWIFMLAQVLIADTTSGRIVNGILFTLVLFFGILLIRSVISEVRQRVKLQLLTAELETTNGKLKEVDKLKTEFLGLASHQLRSPLTAILGKASMLLEGSFGLITNEQQRTEIDQIFQSSRNLTRVIEDLLDVSKIEQGGMQYQMERVDIKILTEDVINELKISATEKGLDLSIDVNDSGSYIIKADKLKIRQVLLNLIDNSIKYTRKGFVNVVFTHPKNGIIRISIIDSGVGIDAENLNSLFEKFSRGAGGKINAGGSGLGLYLAKEIVLAHNGKIWVESNGVGKGATFFLELDELNK